VVLLSSEVHSGCSRQPSVQKQYQQVLRAIGSNDHEQAITLCKEIISQEPAFAAPYKKLSQAYCNAKRNEEALAYFDSLRAAQPQNANAYLGLGLAYSAAEKHEAALRNYQTAISLAPQQPESYAALVEVYAKIKKRNEGLGRLQELTAAYPHLAAPYYGLGYAYYETQTHWQECFAALTRATTLDSTLLDAYRLYGNGCMQTNDETAALPIFEKGLRQALAQNDLEFQSTFAGSLGLVYKRLGQDDLALTHFVQAAELARGTGYKTNEAAAYGHVAAIYRNRGELERAIEHYHRARDLHRQAKSLVGEGNQLNNLGNLYQEEYNDPQQALQYYEEALRFFRQAGNSGAMAEALANLAVVHRELGEYEQALTENAEALSLAETTSRRRVQANVLANRALIHADLADTAAAFRDNRAALALYRQLGDAAKASGMLGNQSIWYHAAGNYSLSLQRAREALALVRAGGQNKAQEALALNAAGMTYSAIGQPRRALSLFRETLTLAEGVQDTSTQASALGNIALMYSHLNQPDSALIYYRQALTRTRRRGDAEFRSLLFANMSMAQGALQRHQAALDTAILGLRLAERIHHMARQGFCLEVIGLMHLKMENYDESLRAFRRSGEIHQKIGQPVGVWRAQTGQARVHKARREYEKAIASYQAAIATIEEVRSGILGEERRSGFWQDKMEVYSELVETFARLSNCDNAAMHAGQALHYAERAKARALLDLVSRGCVFDKSPEAMRRAHESLDKRIQAQYAAIAREVSRRKPDGRSIQKLEGAVEDLRARRDSLGLATQVQNSHETPVVLTFADIQQQVLATGQALLEYLIGKENSFVWLVTKDSCIFQPLGFGRQQLIERLGAVSPLFASTDHSTVSSNKPRSPILDHTDASFSFPALYELYQVLIPQSLEKHLPPSAELIIVPDAVLFYLPFEILVSRLHEGRAEYLIEKHPITYSSSASLLAPELYRPSQAAQNILALADPQVPELSDESLPLLAESGLPMNRLIRNRRLTPLPHAVQEIAAIRAIFPGVQAHAGAGASEARFKARAGGFCLLHLAVHGIANDRQPHFSSLMLAPSRQPEEDGMLHAYEIANIKLQAEMVVLSACESGAGRLMAGEGLLSLTRAFLGAGAHSVVASLWHANDAATAQLMKLFYAGLKKGESRSRALQQAKIALRHSAGRESNPFYWAPFILVGRSGALELNEFAAAR
jgi:CHAT domain-containing protein/tetratricopeptide (TPR) repeat protein